MYQIELLEIKSMVIEIESSMGKKKNIWAELTAD